jgi:RimJ/RimL family protein N-acetyltransferase
VPLPANTLTDGVIVISPLRWADVAPHLAGEDEELVRWLNGGPGSRATVHAHIRRSIERWAADGPKLSFGIRIDDGRTLCGTIDADLDPVPASRQANLSYGLYPQFRGRGLATRAVRLVCRYLSERGDVDRVLIDVDPENVVSSRVAQRAGFRFVVHVSVDEDDFDRYELVVRRERERPPARR